MQLAGEWPRKPDWGGAGTWYFAPLASDPVRAGWIGDGKRGRLYRSSSEAVARREQFCDVHRHGGREASTASSRSQDGEGGCRRHDMSDTDAPAFPQPTCSRP
jgi:hypothetical protein